MTANSIYFQVILLLILCIVPWPGPTVFKITCPRDSAATVRKLVQKKWIPVLEKYQAHLPIECPFHPLRDIYQPQEMAKRKYKSSHWTCGFCGKSFYQEKYLDLHFDNRHRNKINMAEDAVCLADYCDIMRCEVLQVQDEKSHTSGSDPEPTVVTTDLEVWREPSQRNTALTIVGQTGAPSEKYPSTTSVGHKLCNKYDAPSSEKGQNKNRTDNSQCTTLIDSAVPPKQRFVELQKLKAHCKPEELDKLKTRCEMLVRDCIAGLLVNLSIQDFKDVEEELNNAICWYLTCDRYWEDAPSNSKHFSWALFFIPAIILSVALTICYYIIWVLFDSDDGLLEQTDREKYGGGICYTTQYGDEYFSADENSGSNDHYIYVTYPPEIKQRLLDRTTRL